MAGERPAGGDHRYASGTALGGVLNRLPPATQIRRFPLDIPEHVTYAHNDDAGTLRRWQEMARVLLEAAFLQELRAQPSDRGTRFCRIASLTSLLVKHGSSSFTHEEP